MEGSSDGSSDDEDDDEEPLLKYHRMGASVTQLLGTDDATCLHVYAAFIVMGTRTGVVLVLDFHGNEQRRFHCHKQKVNAVSVDRAGTTIASCSDDGTVVVNSLSDSGEQIVQNYHRPVLTVQLDPLYSRQRDNAFASGGLVGKFVLHKRGFLGFGNQDIVLHEGEGPVHRAAWGTHFIAWANDAGVKIYDYDRDERISFIEKPPGSPPADVCPCHLYWETATTLLVAWADCVNIVAIRDRPGAARPSGKDGGRDGHSGGQGAGGGAGGVRGPSKMAEIVALFNTEYSLCGIAPFGDDLALLGFYPPDNEGGVVTPHRPELFIVMRDGGEDLSYDALPVKGFEDNSAADYALGAEHNTVLGEDGLPVLYVIAPKDVVVAKPRGVVDHIAWAVQCEKFEEAVSMAESYVSLVGEPRLVELSEQCLTQLIERGEPARAASMCPRLLRKRADLWDKWVAYFFDELEDGDAADAARANLARAVPLREPRLSSGSYTRLMHFLLHHDPAGFLEAVEQWPRIAAGITERKVSVRSLTEGHGEAGGSGLGDGVEVVEVAGIDEDETESAPPAPRPEKLPRLIDVTAMVAEVQDVINEHTIAEETTGGADAAANEAASRDVPLLLAALAELYVQDHKPDQALRVYLDDERWQGISTGGASHVFDLITINGLFDLVSSKVLRLMQLDEAGAVDMLVANVEHIPAQSVAFQLRAHRRLLHEYLHHMFQTRTEEYNTAKNSDFHELQLSLYAEFAPHHLLEFLRVSQHFPLEKAYEVCSERPEPLYNEMVFILQRMGNASEAFSLIIDKLRDVRQAIQFCQKHDDGEMWDELISRCIASTDLVSELLDGLAGADLDPSRVIRQIPEGLDIPDARDKIMALLEDCHMRLRMVDNTQAIVSSDCIDLMRRLVRSQVAGVRVPANTGHCQLCRETLRLVDPMRVSLASGGAHMPVDIVVFFCSHAYHKGCLRTYLRHAASSARSGKTGHRRQSKRSAVSARRSEAFSYSSDEDDESPRYRCVRCASTARRHRRRDRRSERGDDHASFGGGDGRRGGGSKSGDAGGAGGAGGPDPAGRDGGSRREGRSGRS